MAKPKEGRVPMVNGTPFFRYEDRQYVPGDVVMMTAQDAADCKALRQVRDPTNDELKSYKRRE